MFAKIYDSLLTIVYPQACQICAGSVEHSADGIACRVCWESTRIFSGSETICDKCGNFLSDSGAPVTTFCHRCDEHFYDAARAVGIYEKALAASVVNLKTENHTGATLRRFFISAFHHSNFPGVNLIIPVPLSKKRFHERGFNQAATLAEIIARETKIEIDDASLTRQIHTPMHRAGMDKKARELTVKNAFAVKRSELIKDRTILLVDDVFTSGATVSSCAKALKKAGASKVYVFTLARAV